MSTRQDYIEAIDSYVSGEHPLDDAEKIAAVSRAVKEYSRHRPREVVVEISGDGGFEYAIDSTNFPSWSDGFSVINEIEYPVDDDDEEPDILEEDEWMVYQKPAGWYLRFLADEPESDESFRVTHTALHTCTDTSCTVKDIDEEAVQMLAAAYFCQMLATYYAQAQDATIAADAVDHASKSRDYAGRAKTYRKSYLDHMGIKEGQVKAASVTKDWDPMLPWKEDRLTHSKKWR